MNLEQIELIAQLARDNRAPTAPFLDRYVSDEGESLIKELRRAGAGGKATKGALQFLCYGAAQALEVAKAQHKAGLHAEEGEK